MSNICRRHDCVYNNPHKNQCLAKGIGYTNCTSKILHSQDKEGPTYIFTRPALWFCKGDQKKEIELLKYFTREALVQLISYEYLKEKSNEQY